MQSLAVMVLSRADLSTAGQIEHTAAADCDNISTISNKQQLCFDNFVISSSTHCKCHWSSKETYAAKDTD